MEKRLFLAVILSMAVLLLWQIFFLPPYPASQQPGIPGATSGAEQSTPQQTPHAPDGTPTGTENPVASQAPVDRGASEKTLIIDSPLYRAEVTNWGGALKSFKLKKYAKMPHSEALVEMVPQLPDVQDHFDKEYFESNRTDLLPKIPAEFQKVLLPYTMRFIQGGKRMLLPEAYQMEPSSGPLRLEAGQSAKVTFHLASPQGLTIVKTLTFHADNYLTDLHVEVRNSGSAPVDAVPDLVVSEGYRDSGIRRSTQYDHSQPVYGAAGKRHIPELPDRPDGQRTVVDGKLEWVAVEDLYFLSGIIPRVGSSTLLTEKPAGLGFTRLLVRYDELHLAPGESKSFDAYGYYGPKELKRLQEIGYSFERAIDYGMFRFLALPAVAILKFIDRVTGSYGLAIIVLTILLKVVTYPLTNAQLKSMERMKALAPEMEKLRAKFKDSKEPERFNQEMMALYKRHNVNPASGCLPVLIQMPIFLALYAGLLYSIELRHKGFLYIPDLSTPDPFYLSPLLMGVSMFWQTKMSPAPADPSQATMMRIMPIIFTTMFLFAPAGLVIYWLMNNLLSIGQQYYLRSRNPVTGTSS